MTDSELEFAAKAAGYTFHRSKHGYWIVTTPEGDRVECCVGFSRYDSATGADLGLPSIEDALSELGWMPREDDGDALRLAVRLRIHIEQNKDALYGEFTQCAAIGIHWNDRPVEWWDKNESPEAATRRAIVRAAAEIGRNMP